MAKKLYVIYRISDKGNPKWKLSNGGKGHCLENAIDLFGVENIHIIADNCEAKTVQVLRSLNLDVEETSNGNAGTCRYIFNEVINRYRPDDCLYLLEDDYLHLPNSREAILEGLEIADYVTLYDHPDMYHPTGDGDNPFVRREHPKCSIYLTAHTHWRSTIATTFTYAAKAKTLAEDREIWLQFSQGRNPTAFFAFVTLTKQDSLEDAKYLVNLNTNVNVARTLATIVINNILTNNRPRRLLITPIPSLSTHTEIKYLAPLIDWSKV